QQRQRSSGQRSSSGRSASLAVRCDIAGPIAAKQRKKERKQSNGYSVSIYYVAGDRWCQCAGALLRLETREAAEISLLRRKKGCQGCDNSISARWEIGADLVGSVGSGGRCRDSRWTGLESTIKSARDRKRSVYKARDHWYQCAKALARLETGEAAGISLEIYYGERKDTKFAATLSALAGRSVLILLVPSVAKADVATVDGLESTIKSAHDQKRWKLAAV
ncbi:hypothetical protein BHM03_00048186, partial [Ensete ventricosum]